MRRARDSGGGASLGVSTCELEKTHNRASRVSENRKRHAKGRYPEGTNGLEGERGYQALLLSFGVQSGGQLDGWSLSG
jgi:hypothetical protein